MWAAWHYGGEDPYRLYNMLGSDYRPLWAPHAAAIPPRYPERLQRFMYGLARASAIMEGKLKDVPYMAKDPAPRPSRARLTDGQKTRPIYGPHGDVLSTGTG